MLQANEAIAILYKHNIDDNIVLTIFLFTLISKHMVISMSNSTCSSLTADVPLLLYQLRIYKKQHYSKITKIFLTILIHVHISYCINNMHSYKYIANYSAVTNIQQ